MGQIALLYGMLYSVERYFVEGLRTDSLMLGNFRIAQLMSLAAILVCGALYIVLKNKNERDRLKR